jgi:prolyl oligopeptidase
MPVYTVLAIANIRGGGEYGHSWYLSGCKEKRHLVFEDIKSAIKYLKTTIGSETVILMGESMGGLNSKQIPCPASIYTFP